MAMSRQMLRRDYLGQERVIRQEEVKITRWQLIAEKIRDAHTAQGGDSRCMLVYEAVQLLEPEELESLAITKEDIQEIETHYRNARMGEMEIIQPTSRPLSKVVCRDGTVYEPTGRLEDRVENFHNALNARLRIERTIGKIIRVIVKHAESMGIKVSSINVQIPGPGGSVFGRTRMVGTLPEEQREDRRE